MDEEKKFTVLKMKEELEESNVALPPIDKLNAEVFEKVKVSERCERALMMTKTRILAINPAKWLQDGLPTSTTEQKLFHSIRFRTFFARRSKNTRRS